MKKLVPALLMLSTAACTKKDGALPTPGGTLTDYNTFIDQPSDGSFSIDARTSMTEQDSVRALSVGGGFLNGTKPSVTGGPVTVGQLPLPTDFEPHLGFYYDDELSYTPSLFGGDIIFDINPNGDGQITGNHATIILQIPPSIHMLGPAPADTIWSGRNGTSPNTITWIADPANTKNVILGCEYYSSDNPSLLSTYPSNISHNEAVPDNGSYTLRPADLAGFPEGAVIRVSVTRLAYTLGYSQDGTKKYIVNSQDAVDQQHVFE